MKFTEIDFIESLFALLISNGVTKFNEKYLDKTIKEQLDKSHIFNYAHADVILSLGIDMFINRGITKKDDEYELLFDEDYIKKVIANLSDEQKAEINKIVAIYKNSLPGSISIDDLIKLILAHFKESSLNVSSLPANYKLGIKEIMNQDNRWKENFLSFIDLRQYQNNIEIFLIAFSSALEKYVRENKKKINYDFGFDTIEIDFSEKEKSEILNKYDEETRAKLDHFCSLIKLLPYDLEWQREHERKEKGFRKKLIKYLQE